MLIFEYLRSKAEGLPIEDKKPFWHGRRMKHSEQITKVGFCLPKSCEEDQKEIMAALTNFKKAPNDLVDNLLHEICREGRRAVYVSSMEDGAKSSCGWAGRNPEIVSLALDYIGVPEKEVEQYLDKTYGKTHAIRLSNKYLAPKTWEDNNVNTGMRCLKPEDIAEILKCKTSR